MAAQNKYKPTFTESKPRPVMSRLTPLAWFCVFLVGLALIGALIVTIRKLTDNNGVQTLDQRLGQNTSAPAVVAAANVAVTTDSAAPSAQTQPAAVPIATTVPVVETAPTAALAQSAAPTKAAALVYKVAWADKMTQQADGSWTAPAEVVSKASSDIKEYYELARNRPLGKFMQQRDQILTTYYIGDGLQLMATYEKQRTQYGMNKSGDVSVEVKSFAQDGLTAQVAVTTKNWVNDIYDIETRQLTKSDFKQQDSTLNLAIRFDVTGNRWKIEKVLGIVRLH